MARKTVYITKPTKLSLKNEQLHIYFVKTEKERIICLEEIGFLVIEHTQTSLTLPLLSALSASNVAVVICNIKHLPQGLLLPLNHHHKASYLFAIQIDASKPLKKQLWKKVIQAKISQQARLLAYCGAKYDAEKLCSYASEVKSGDTSQRESLAAQYYWPSLMGKGFLRDYRSDDYTNKALNYGYAILRTAVARALIGSGLHPMAGLHHCNRYNPYPLADDIMEPYRPFIDQKVKYVITHKKTDKLTLADRTTLVKILQTPCQSIKGQTLLQTAIEETTASLAKALKQKKYTILYYPKLIDHSIK